MRITNTHTQTMSSYISGALLTRLIAYTKELYVSETGPKKRESYGFFIIILATYRQIIVF